MNHSSVWGSYWQNGSWGYKCCHSLVKNSYCTGEAGKVAAASLPATTEKKSVSSSSDSSSSSSSSLSSSSDVCISTFCVILLRSLDNFHFEAFFSSNTGPFRFQHRLEQKRRFLVLLKIAILIFNSVLLPEKLRQSFWSYGAGSIIFSLFRFLFF